MRIKQITKEDLIAILADDQGGSPSCDEPTEPTSNQPTGTGRTDDQAIKAGPIDDRAVASALDQFCRELVEMFNPAPFMMGGMTLEELADRGWQFFWTQGAFEKDGWRRRVTLVNGDGAEMSASVTNDEFRRLLAALPLNGESAEEAGL